MKAASDDANKGMCTSFAADSPRVCYAARGVRHDEMISE